MRTVKLALVILVALGVFGFWALRTEAGNRTLGRFPVPAALVAGEPVYLSDLTARVDLAKQVRGGEGISPQVLRAQVLGQLISEAKLRRLARIHNVSVSGDDLRAEQASSAAVGQDLKEELASAGLSAGSYRSQVLEPALLSAKLKRWFYGQEALNEGAYRKAGELKDRLASGASFEVLATQSSEDDLSRLYEGDLGAVAVSALLPEVAAEVGSMQAKETRLVVSRQGLHIIRLEAGPTQTPGGAVVHIRQIFLRGNDFNAWAAKETAGYRVWQFIR